MVGHYGLCKISLCVYEYNPSDLFRTICKGI